MEDFICRMTTCELVIGFRGFAHLWGQNQLSQRLCQASGMALHVSGIEKLEEQLVVMCMRSGPCAGFK